MSGGLREDLDDVLTVPRVVGGGAAVLAVWALLDLIRHVVGHSLDGQVTNAWIAGRQVAQKTQVLHVLSRTREHAAELVEELERQQQELGGTQS